MTFGKQLEARKRYSGEEFPSYSLFADIDGSTQPQQTSTLSLHSCLYVTLCRTFIAQLR